MEIKHALLCVMWQHADTSTMERFWEIWISFNVKRIHCVREDTPHLGRIPVQANMLMKFPVIEFLWVQQGNRASPRYISL